MQPLAERPARIARGRAKALQDFLSLFRPAKSAYKHFCMAKIRRNFDVGYGHEANAWILHLAFEDFAQFDPQLLFDSINSPALHDYTISILP
jgi:hypothetical protein